MNNCNMVTLTYRFMKDSITVYNTSTSSCHGVIDMLLRTIIDIVAYLGPYETIEPLSCCIEADNYIQ